MKNLFLEFAFLVSLFYLINSFDALSFQLYFKKTEDPIFSYFFTILKLGQPESSIYSHISSKIFFSMTKGMKISYDKDIKNYYDITCSNSFQNISSLGYKFVSSNKDIHAIEKFIFNTYNNRTKKYKEIIINELDFVLGVKTFSPLEEIFYMNIGFPIIKSNTIRDKFNLILQLKEKNIIDTYDWFIYFEQGKEEIINLENIDDINPTLIIGGQPHYYRNDLFYKSQLITSYTDVYGLIMNFKDVYLYIRNKDSEEMRKISTFVENVEIYLDKITIYAPPYYTNIIKREFFNKYDACHEVRDEEYTYYCDKSADFTIDDLKNFPSLYFQHIGFNYTFELTYKDLFVENKGKYLFLVTENNEEDEIWYIGFPILKKYQLVFNQDYKTIGFYNPNLPKEKEIDNIDGNDDENNNKTDDDTNSDGVNGNETNNDIDNTDQKSNNGMSGKSVALIVVLTGIVFIVVGLIIGKMIFKKINKRKRANELKDDIYDYTTNESDDNIN